MKYCQLAIFPESEIEIEIEPKVTLEMARRSMKSQVRSLSKYYGIPEYIVHITLTTDYIAALDYESMNIYFVLFLSLIHLPE